MPAMPITQQRGGRLVITHRGQCVAEHEGLPGKYRMHVLSEHGPGAIARPARRATTGPALSASPGPDPDVEIRNLAVYETLSLATVPA
jgi:hypothetical protein